MEETDKFEVFWQTFPADLCNRKGSKKKARIQWDKLTPDIHAQIIINMRELIRVERRLKKSNEFVPKWPMVTTWLNGERWADIEDIRQSESMPAQVARKCTCGSDAAINGKCWPCHDSNDPKRKAHMKYLYSHLISIGLGKNPDESKEDWIARCKAHTSPRIGRLVSNGAEK